MWFNIDFKKIEDKNRTYHPSIWNTGKPLEKRVQRGTRKSKE